MPKIRWKDLPPALREHLFERLREREISAEDLYELKRWRESEPGAPEGAWYKDFGRQPARHLDHTRSAPTSAWRAGG